MKRKTTKSKNSVSTIQEALNAVNAIAEEAVASGNLTPYNSGFTSSGIALQSALRSTFPTPSESQQDALNQITQAFNAACMNIARNPTDTQDFATSVNTMNIYVNILIGAQKKSA